MIYADYLVLISILALTLVNRQSIIFLAAFALCEVAFIIPVNDVIHSIVVSLTFSVVARLNNLKLPLKIATLGYSIMFWISAVSYQFYAYETYLDVVFPYAIKLIDVFVIIYLIANREKVDARDSRDNSYFSGAFR